MDLKHLKQALEKALVPQESRLCNLFLFKGLQ